MNSNYPLQRLCLFGRNVHCIVEHKEKKNGKKVMMKIGEEEGKNKRNMKSDSSFGIESKTIFCYFGLVFISFCSFHFCIYWYCNQDARGNTDNEYFIHIRVIYMHKAQLVMVLSWNVLLIISYFFSVSKVFTKNARKTWRRKCFKWVQEEHSRMD